MSVSPRHAPARTSVVGLFDPAALGLHHDIDRDDGVERRSALVPSAPSEIITTPATPLAEAPDVYDFPDMDIEPVEDVLAVKAKLSTFSFGAKTPSRSPVPTAQSQNLLARDFTFSSTSPLHSPTTSSVSAPSALHRLSARASRPPSLLLARPTPLSFGTPGAPGRSRSSLGAAPQPPSTPPTVARRRHSHTRSESISLPNLKTGRPGSLGIPSSPSYPSPPCSPASSGDGSARFRLSGPINGTRLKFEPSGRGAEAEKEKEEYRRKALEQLTGGGRSSPQFESFSAKINLPDLDDDDRSSIASSVRPLSDTFSFAQPSAPALPQTSSLSASSSPSILSASPCSWSSNPEDLSSPAERWSGFGSKTGETKENGLGFGVDLGMTMAKRPSLARNLSILAEVDEDTDLEDEAESTDQDEAIDHFLPVQETEEPAIDNLPISAPSPIRLRELHLLTSVSSTPSRPTETSTFTFPRPTSSIPSAPLCISPTREYGAIGRGRPRPLYGIPGNVFSAGTSSSPSTNTVSTPRSGRRGAKTSSISYKRDRESSQSGSSHDWSMGSKGLISPPTEGFRSPQSSFESPAFGGWGHVPRAAGRPCPRPKNIVGLGLDNKGSGRVLGEVDEAEEDEDPGMTDAPGRPSSEISHDSFHWRDDRLEVEMERNALKDDVELWRKRCRGLEDRLEAERKDGAMLRERVRKREFTSSIPSAMLTDGIVSDRLSFLSASHPLDLLASTPSPGPEDSSPIVEMRDQLFALTAALERERREKEEALQELVKLRDSRANSSILEDPASPSPTNLPFPPLSFACQPATDDDPDSTARPTPSIPTPIVTPATPLPDTDDTADDPNVNRMKAWGFPRVPAKATKTAKKRDSFFGLSSIPREEPLEETLDGVDLPPFIFSDSKATISLPSVSPHVTISPKRTVSQPLPTSARAVPMARSASLTHSASSATSSALSFFSSYLPLKLSSPMSVRPGMPRSPSESSIQSSLSSLSSIRHLADPIPVGRLDFREGCRCCVGDVVEF